MGLAKRVITAASGLAIRRRGMLERPGSRSRVLKQAETLAWQRGMLLPSGAPNAHTAAGPFDPPHSGRSRLIALNKSCRDPSLGIAAQAAAPYPDVGGGNP